VDPAERERKRLRRLMRNRLSAQQARERKKAYTTTIENKTRDLDSRYAALQERVCTLEQENKALRALCRTAILPAA